MPQPPKPNVLRAIIGFPLGFVLTLLIVGLARYLIWNIGFYAVDLNLADKIFAGWFWEDEATFMWALFGGAMGFLWGAGMIYNRSQQVETSKAIAPRIPVDPDAPPDLSRNPIAPLFEAIPSMLIVTAVIVVLLVLVGLVPLTGQTQQQTVNDAADFGEYGEVDFNLLGIVQFEDTSQAQLLVGFAVFIVLGVLATGIFIALVVFMLNRQVRVTAAQEPAPQEGEQFLPIRLVAFFTDWAYDILNGVGTLLRPR